jgi:hypothetical protein
MSATATPYRHGYDIAQPSPTTSSLFNFKKWAEDGAHDNRRGHCSLDEEDAFTYTKRWNACPFDADAYSDEPGRFTEWVYQPDEMGRHHHQHPYYDVPESMVASSSSTSVWCHSGVASTASTSVDSLGLHHVTLGSPSAESSPPPPPLSAASAVSVISAPPGPDSPAGTGGPVYDKTSTCVCFLVSFFFRVDVTFACARVCVYVQISPQLQIPYGHSMSYPSWILCRFRLRLGRWLIGRRHWRLGVQWTKKRILSGCWVRRGQGMLNWTSLSNGTSAGGRCQTCGCKCDAIVCRRIW